MTDIQARIVDYLDLGGFFNPEAMSHDKVRTLIMDAADEICRLRAEIADAREACPSIRMQDHFDASLLELVNLEVSRGFNRDAEIYKLRAALLSSDRAAKPEILGYRAPITAAPYCLSCIQIHRPWKDWSSSAPVYDTHETCIQCGKSLRASSDRAVKEPDNHQGCRADCWYCNAPGWLYRHSGGYNISMCDNCRGSVKAADGLVGL